MSTPFTPEQLEALSLDIDEQLAELQANSSTALHKGNEPDKQEISERLPVQWRAIKEISKEDPQTFWQRFKKAAHNDLCEEDGVLNKQWRKWGDLSNKEVLRILGAVLAAMGFTGSALQMLVVAVAVIVIHLGCTAICDEE